jgi:hypothetical protein
MRPPRTESVAISYMIEVGVRDLLTQLGRKALILLDTCLRGAQVA